MNSVGPQFRNFKAPVKKARFESVDDPNIAFDLDHEAADNNGPLNRVMKGWGREDWMLNNDRLCMKILTLDFMRSCSMHYHMKKEEIFFVVAGSMIFDFIDTENGDIKTVTMEVGDTVHIPPGVPHKMTGAAEGGCVFVECSTKHEDEDSYRVAPGDSQNADYTTQDSGEA